MGLRDQLIDQITFVKNQRISELSESGCLVNPSLGFLSSFPYLLGKESDVPDRISDLLKALLSVPESKTIFRTLGKSPLWATFLH